MRRTWRTRRCLPCWIRGVSGPVWGIWSHTHKERIAISILSLTGGIAGCTGPLHLRVCNKFATCVRQNILVSCCLTKLQLPISRIWSRVFGERKTHSILYLDAKPCCQHSTHSHERTFFSHCAALYAYREWNVQIFRFICFLFSYSFILLRSGFHS